MPASFLEGWERGRGFLLAVEVGFSLLVGVRYKRAISDFCFSGVKGCGTRSGMSASDGGLGETIGSVSWIDA